MAQYQGSCALSGLGESVTVRWQSHGIPHIFAGNEEDLFFAQGFLHAQERLWQMDLSRRYLSGRLAEIFGAFKLPWREIGSHLRGRDASEFDFFMRLIGVSRAARTAETVLDEPVRRHLQKYADGVNRYIDACGKKLPWEFRLLRYTPEPWTPLDSLIVGKGFALLLSTALYTRLNRVALAAKLERQPEKLRALWPAYPEPAPTITRALWRSTENLWQFANGSWASSDWQAAGHGSNNWALAGARSTTGSAILCNDPHLRFSLPSTFYLMHLRSALPAGAGAENYEAWGASIPGLPYIQLGHNRHIAWGATAALCDDVELYREKLHRLDGELYLAGNQWRRLTQSEEIFHTKGQPSLKRTIRSTLHGPLISDFSSAKDSGEVLALRWTAHEASQEFRAAYGINRARNWTEFLTALADHSAPTLNYVYADRDNNIGYCLAGKIPLRADNPSLLPVDGWEPANEWRGFIPFEELPRLYNPPEGAVATANNRIVDAAYGHPFAQLYEPEHRIRRIKILLDADSRLSLADMAAIQKDTLSLHALELVQQLTADLKQAALTEPKLSALVRNLLDWDGICHEQSMEAALFHVFHHRLISNLLVPTLGDELFRAYVEILNQCIAPLNNILSDPASVWFAERSRQEIVTQSLQEACAELGQRFGADSRRWRWGSIHSLALKHALGRNLLLNGIANLGPLPAPGDGMTVNAGHYRHSNPYEQIIGAGPAYDHRYRRLGTLQVYSPLRTVRSPAFAPLPRSVRPVVEWTRLALRGGRRLQIS